MAPSGGRDRLGAELDRDLRIDCEKLRREGDHRRVGGGDLQVAQKDRGDQLVNQDPAMLRVVEELDDVKATVIPLDQVSLSASAHFSNMPASVYRHRTGEYLGNLSH